MITVPFDNNFYSRLFGDLAAAIAHLGRILEEILNLRRFDYAEPIGEYATAVEGYEGFITEALGDLLRLNRKPKDSNRLIAYYAWFDLVELWERIKGIRHALGYIQSANPNEAIGPPSPKFLASQAAARLAVNELIVWQRRFTGLSRYFFNGGSYLDLVWGADAEIDAALDYYSKHRPELVWWAAPARPQATGTEPADVELKIKALPFETRIVPVMFATDRREVKQSDSIRTEFLNGRNQGGKISYGVAEVSIPRGHKRGKLERPSLWKLQFREDRHKHIAILSCDKKNRASWRAIAQARLKETESKAALIFIHGFATSFDEAIRHAAQIGYDLQFGGLVTAFSWCSEAKIRIRSYAADISNARLSVQKLIKFLTFLRTSVGATEISIIAHSMGNLILIEALRTMKIGKHKMQEVVFAAPDYDAEEFRQAASDIMRKARRYTLYGSEHDKALWFSKKMRKGYARAGDGGNNVLIVAGVETIDASALGRDLLGLEHSYFSSKRTLLSDLYYVIKHSLPPSHRDSLISAQRNGFEYWVFQP